LPWARTEVFAQRANARILAPHWKGFRLGPYVRCEPEKRNYAGFFHAPGYVHGLESLLIRMVALRIPETQASQTPFRVRGSRRPVLVEFDGIGGLFMPLLGHSTFIRERLWEMTAVPMRPAIPGGGPFIAMHVRRGDLTRQGLTPEQLAAVNQYTPLTWFLAMARAVRRCRALASVPILVFTDGTADEVADLCRIDGVRLNPRGHAITDLWILTQCRLLFASGFSTFGMWASFLGGMPTVYAPGKLQQHVQADRTDSLELELPADADIPDSISQRATRTR